MDGLDYPWRKKNPYIFCKFDPMNTDTQLIQTLYMAPSVSILTGFDWEYKTTVFLILPDQVDQVGICFV